MERSRKASPQTLSLLAALMERPRAWRHGYDLSHEAGLKSGTLYPILMRLGDRGLLESRWQPSPEAGRPARHMYRLTADGAAFAREQLADSAETADVIHPARASS
jgi:DNA-binding PadR family transcriptional regulator